MKIRRTQARDTVIVTFNNKEPYEGEVGTTLQAFCEQWAQDHELPKEQVALAAVVDNRLRELSYPVTSDVNVQPITLAHRDGSRIYRRTLSFLLVVAVAECFGEQLKIEHAVPSGGFFCRMSNRDRLTDDELEVLRAKMLEIIKCDNPIQRRNIPLEEAQQIFADRNDDDKLRLLEVREQNYLSVYELRGYVDYFFGYMAPSTRHLHTFGLKNFGDGFVLRYPRRESPGELNEFFESPKLAGVFRQTSDWLKLIGINDIGRLNQVIAGGDAGVREMVLVHEALHERKIAEIAQEAVKRYHKGVRVILIAGPSSSGKTTSSKRLAIQLLTHGIHPFTVEMDNYFVNRADTPRDEKGDYDFEALEALNVTLLNENLQDLIAGKTVQLPKFDFTTGRSLKGRKISVPEHTMLILEGIHGMNPGLTPSFGPDETFKIYISALTQINIDRHNRVPTTDVRLIRRILRDAHHRNYTAEDTIKRWPSVRRGEKRNIFFYQENADIMFNSSLVYELAVLRPLVEPLLLRVDPYSALRVEAHRLLSFLSWVRPMDTRFIPDNSLLREFVGGSILRDYHPGT